MTERVEVGVEASKPPSEEVEVTLRRDLGLAEVLMIGLGPNIGSTIFVLIGFAVGIAGPAIILAFILNFFVTLFTAMAYAELASAFPETGGGYLWIKEGLPAPFGFLGGWMSWVGHCIACAVYSLGFGLGVSALLQQYGIDFFGLSPDAVGKIFAVVIAVAFIYLNYRGVKGAGRSELLVSIFLIGIIAIFVLFCVGYVLGYGVTGDAFTPFFNSGGLLSVATSMAFTFMIFEGYEVVAQTGEEAKDPETTVPKAMFLCISISCVLFVVIAVVTLAVLGQTATAAAGADALILASSKAVPFIGGALISIGIIVGSVAAVNSIVFSASRVSFAMGRDGNLPQRFGKLHKANQTPTMALLFSGTIIILASVLLPINSVASVADILILLLFTLVNVAAITLRRKRPDVKRHFITPFFPVIPLVGIGTKLFLAVTLFAYEPLAWYLAFVVMFAGLLLHYFARARKEIERIAVAEKPPLTEEQRKIYRVLVPVEDPKHLSLIDVGATIATAHGGELLLVSVVEVPTAVPLDAVDQKLVEDRKKMLEKLKRVGETRGARTRAMVAISHEIVTAIIDTAKDEAANTVLIGWKGYTRSQKRVFGRKLDEILRQTPCDVILLKAEDRLVAEKVLVLSGGLWHVSSATEVAAWLAKSWGGRVTILDAIINEAHLAKAREYAKRLTGIVESEGVLVVTKEVHPETIVGGVVAESMEYDLLVMGASSARGWERFAFGPIQDRIIKSAKCPVLVYKRTIIPSGDESAIAQEEREELDEEREEERHERSSGSRQR
jgi:amino acid transporter/nucleotide-binding universal stress UspA family protein